MKARNVVVIGTQWGDEGKGKIVDWLTDHVAGVARFQGGHNAGHTLVIKGRKTILRTLPPAASPWRLLLPFGADRTLSRELRKSGWITVAALEPAGDWRAEARRLGCAYVLEGDRPVAIA